MRHNRFLVCNLFCIFVGAAVTAGPILDRVRERRAESQSLMSITVNGVERQYILHLPARYQRRSGEIPLVLFFHGGKSKAESMDRLTGFNAMADRNNFIVVYPKGIDERWNDGRGSPLATADDVGFVQALIDQLIVDYRVDSRRVYATGISNGAILTHLLACELSDKIAAIAPVAGTLPTNVFRKCRPSQKVPVLMIHGTRDSLILWDGGTGEKRGQIGGSTLSVTDSIKFWASCNGADEVSSRATTLDTQRDGTMTLREEFGPDVVLYKVVNGGHTWPSGWQYAPELIIGKTSKDFNATDVIWNFFRIRSRS